MLAATLAVVATEAVAVSPSNRNMFEGVAHDCQREEEGRDSKGSGTGLVG